MVDKSPGSYTQFQWLQSMEKEGYRANDIAESLVEEGVSLLSKTIRGCLCGMRLSDVG